MKKIITAVGNSLINEKLKNTNKYIIQTPDINFEDDLLEAINNKNDTDILILNLEIIKNEEINNYINKIKKANKFIKIILLVKDKNEYIENIISYSGIKDVFYGNEIKLEKLEEAINRNKTTEEILTEEINNLKEIILNENKTKNKKEKNNKLNNKIKNEIKSTNKNNESNKIKNNLIKFSLIKKLNNKNKEINFDENINNKISKNINGKIISITGSSGVGKSIFCSNLSLAYENKKILIIDFDILNKSIKTIFGVREKVAEEKENWNNNNELNNLIIKINKNVDLISGIDVLFEEENKIEKEKLIEILNKLKNKYEIILLDTSSECFLDYTKEIIKISNYSLFLVEANLIELKKSKKLLEIYINEWQIEKNKINIIFNKYNKNSIDNILLKNIFSDFKILGNLKLNEIYNYNINKNSNKINEELKKEYKKIIEKIK